ncbi:MAG: isoprenoid biosynthesis glyoxalase ElbB [Bernardetiaceae bacterium]|nr:isoprenoid biosynthesis glyoxalase ElbB [Bernardetiaceae bacterium]
MNNPLKIGVLLAGNGVYDGSETHEAVLTLLALDQLGVQTVCLAPNVPQLHVINHLTGEEMPETRNVLVESARIARGNIQPLDQVKVQELDGLAMTGGFGAAKNLTTWALAGPAGQIEPSVRDLLRALVRAGKPIAAVCIAPAVVALAFQGTDIHPRLTVGTTAAASPYDIAATSAALEQTGAQTRQVAPTAVLVDDVNNIISSPCYMMESSIAQVYEGIEKTMNKLVEMISLAKQS